jgi:hypothetical protein
MSSRVSIPTASRLMGSAQPPRPSPLRVGPRGLAIGVVSREPRHHPLMLLSYAFGTCPPHPSPRCRPSVSLAVDLVRGHSRRSHRTGARLHLDSSGRNHRDRKRPRCVSSGVIAETALSGVEPSSCDASLLPRASATCATDPQSHSAPGSLRRLPARVDVAACDPSRGSPRPAGFASPDSSRLANLPAMFQAGTSMGTLPSEASLRPCRPTLSDPTVLPAVFRLAASRLRGFELR